MHKLTVYTAITDDRDILREPEVVTPGVRYVCMSDTAKPVGPWEVIPMPSAQTCPVRQARNCKVIGYRLLDSEFSIWIDATYNPRADMMALVYRHLNGADVATFPHFCRDCLYDEAKEILTCKLDDPELVQRQMDFFRADEYPVKYGLSDTSVLVRRHCRAVHEMCGLWWEIIDSGSRRDQLSFNYALWAREMRWNRITPGVTRAHDNYVETFQPYFAAYFHPPKLWVRPDQPAASSPVPEDS